MLLRYLDSTATLSDGLVSAPSTPTSDGHTFTANTDSDSLSQYENLKYDCFSGKGLPFYPLERLQSTSQNA